MYSENFGFGLGVFSVFIRGTILIRGKGFHTHLATRNELVNTDDQSSYGPSHCGRLTPALQTCVIGIVFKRLQYASLYHFGSSHITGPGTMFPPFWNGNLGQSPLATSFGVKGASVGPTLFFLSFPKGAWSYLVCTWA